LEVYSQGFSLINQVDSSIIPCLIPKGIAKAVKEATNMKFKILLLNNCHDRETTGFNSATDYIQAIVNAYHHSLRSSEISEMQSWTKYVTHLVYLRGCGIEVNLAELKSRGIECVGVWPKGAEAVYESDVLERVLTGLCSGRGSGLQRRATVGHWPIV
jgi:2-phospho-L-lactate transferase/gluconeogenesis factor (CofD/UPF0052 family)